VRVVAGQRLPPLPGIGQLTGQHVQFHSGPGGGAGGDQRQGEGQPSASGDDLLYRLGFGRDPLGAEASGQQFLGLTHGQQVQVDGVGAVGGDQARELVAAGHQHQAGGGAGEQRADLGGVPGVVQHHQHPPTRQQAAVQRRLRVKVDRDLLWRNVESIEETAHRLARRHHLPARAKPPQVHIQLPVREPVGHPMRPVHRQRGLAHPGGTADRGDHHRAGGLGASGQQPGQCG